MYEGSVQHTNGTDTALIADSLGKRYGDFWALRDVSLTVPAGSVLGLLGHNGAGKSTAIRIFTTLALPTTGSARVAGFDVVEDAARVRTLIGLTSQYATVDDLMSARANLEMIARLYHLPRSSVHGRAEQLLERLGLADVADRLVRTFSGGMRRRLDLAASLIAAPPVLFLDEPTTGLDPESRNEIWALLGELVRDGATLVLTTQYLEEADRIADQIVVLDHGRIVAKGAPSALKSRIGGERIDVNLEDRRQLELAAGTLAAFADGPVATDAAAAQLTTPVKPGTRLVEVVRALDAAGVDATDVHRRGTTLDDVFLSLVRTHERSQPEQAPAR